MLNESFEGQRHLSSLYGDHGQHALLAPTGKKGKKGKKGAPAGTRPGKVSKESCASASVTCQGQGQALDLFSP